MRHACVLLVLLACSRETTPASRPARTAIDRVDVLPSRVNWAGWFRTDRAPLVQYLEAVPGGLPPCAVALKANLEGHLQAGQTGGADNILVFEGKLDRDQVEACIPVIGERLGQQWTAKRDGAVTAVVAASGGAQYLGWTTRGDVVLSKDRAAVDEVLAHKTSARSNAQLAALIGRVGTADSSWIVASLDLTSRLIGVPSSGFFFSGDLPAPGSKPLHPEVLFTLTFATPDDAKRAVPRIAEIAHDARFSPDLQQALAAMHPTAVGSDVHVDLFPIFGDPKRMGELTRVGMAWLTEQSAPAPAR